MHDSIISNLKSNWQSFKNFIRSNKKKIVHPGQSIEEALLAFNASKERVVGTDDLSSLSLNSYKKLQNAWWHLTDMRFEDLGDEIKKVNIDQPFDQYLLSVCEIIEQYLDDKRKNAQDQVPYIGFHAFATKSLDDLKQNSAFPVKDVYTQSSTSAGVEHAFLELEFHSQYAIYASGNGLAASGVFASILYIDSSALEPCTYLVVYMRAIPHDFSPDGLSEILQVNVTEEQLCGMFSRIDTLAAVFYDQGSKSIDNAPQTTVAGPLVSNAEPQKKESIIL